MEPEFSFLCRKELAAGSYSEPLQFIPHSRAPFLLQGCFSMFSSLMQSVFVSQVTTSHFLINIAYKFSSALRVLCVSTRYLILLMSPYYLTKRTTLDSSHLLHTSLSLVFLSSWYSLSSQYILSRPQDGRQKFHFWQGHTLSLGF